MSINYKKLREKAEKTLGKNLNKFLVNEETTWSAMNTGSVIINKIIGIGGFPKGLITEVYGPESCGKTTLALHAIHSCQKEGKIAVHIDYERAFNELYARSLGVDLSKEKFWMFQPDSLEEGSDAIKAILSDEDIAPHIGLVSIDSIAAMQPQKIIDGEAIDENIGLQARKLAPFLAWYSKLLEKNKIVGIMINQERTNIKMTPYSAGPDIKSTGGKALQYYNSLRLHMKVKNYELDEVINPIDGAKVKTKVSQVVKVTCVKNRCATPFLSGSIVIRYGVGIDNFLALIEIAKGKEKIWRKGPWFYYKSLLTGEDKKFQGNEQVVDFFKNNPDEYESLKKWFSEEDISMSEEERERALADLGKEVKTDETLPPGL